MSEAVITRGGIGGGSADISNETKASLGLPNSATLDDVIVALGLKSETVGTIQVQLLDADGTPLSNHSIKMDETGGTSLTYTTDNQGKAVFKTDKGQATFSEASFEEYFDIKKADNVIVDCPIGAVKTIVLQRHLNLTNGQNIQIVSNQSLKFSKFMNTINACCIGGSGATSYPRGTVGIYVDYDGSGDNWDYYALYVNNINYTQGQENGTAGYKNNAIISIEADKSYQCNIGSSGAGGTIWKNTVITFGRSMTGANRNFDSVISGNAGGITKFGDAIYASGGSGGSAYTTSTHHSGLSAWTSPDTGGQSLAVRNETGSRGSKGYIYASCNSIGGNINGSLWLNNIQYKHGDYI